MVRCVCFIAADADVNFIDNYGQTPLHRAFNFQMVVSRCRWSNVSARDERGTAVQAAAASSERNWKSMLPAFVAAGADVDRRITGLDADRVESACREIAKMRHDFVRHRAMDVCIGMQALRLDAWQMCEISQHSCGPLARLIAFHQWWTIATTVMHFHRWIEPLVFIHRNS